jgi:hypothetical protein
MRFLLTLATGAGMWPGNLRQWERWASTLRITHRGTEGIRRSRRSHCLPGHVVMLSEDCGRQERPTAAVEGSLQSSTAFGKPRRILTMHHPCVGQAPYSFAGQEKKAGSLDYALGSLRESDAPLRMTIRESLFHYQVYHLAGNVNLLHDMLSGDGGFHFFISERTLNHEIFRRIGRHNHQST